MMLCSTLMETFPWRLRMREIGKIEYQCEVCGQTYEESAAAEKCESKAVSKNRGVKVGDRVKIINGDSSGSFAKVTRIGIFDYEWGNSCADRYHHTIYLIADVIGSFGTRMLPFDSYEVVNNA